MALFKQESNDFTSLKGETMTNTEYLFLEWHDIQRLSEKVADKIMQDQYKADLIVAVSRGGFDPSRILSDQLNVRKMASLQTEYYTGLNEKKSVPEILFPLNANVAGLKILIVDDVSDTGNSLLVVKKHIEHLKPGAVKIATLHCKPWSGYRPDYYAEEVDKWIIYPWELKESITILSQKLRADGVNEDEIDVKLVKLGFTQEQVQRYLHKNV